MKKVGFICVTVFMLLTACNGSESIKKTVVKEIKKETKMLRPEKAEEVKLSIGGSFKDFYANYPKAKIKRVGDDKWGYTTFYTLRWSSNKPANLTISYKDMNLSLENTIYMMLTEESEDTQKGLKTFQLQTGITQADLMTYEEARVKFYAFLQKLLKQGWKRALVYDDPRISGRHAMHYKLTEEDMYYQDPTYEPTLEEWKKLETGGMSSSNFWVLHYKSKVFLEINLGVVPHKTDPELASYLMFITMRDGEEEAMGYMKPTDKPKWKELWEERLEKASKNRIKAEDKVKTKGYSIDESYEDYVIDPKEW